MRITLALLLLCSTAFADPFDYTLPVSVPSGWPHLPTRYFGSNTNFFQANTNNPDFRTAVQAVGGGCGGGGITLSDATNAAQTVVGWSNNLYLPLHGTADTATTALGGWPNNWPCGSITSAVSQATHATNADNAVYASKATLTSTPSQGVLGIDGSFNLTTTSITPGLVGAQPTNSLLTQLAGGNGGGAFSAQRQFADRDGGGGAVAGECGD